MPQQDRFSRDRNSTSRMYRDKKEALSLLLTSILVICAIIVTGLVVKQEVFESREPNDGFASSSLTNAEWQRVLGEKSRPEVEKPLVRVVNFYDYQCPFCSQVEPVLEEIQRRYPEQVEIIRRHLPLSNHPRAYQAALAVECAGRQGAFSEYHASLFDNQGILGEIDFDSLAANTVAIKDEESFDRCLGDEQTAQQVDSDMEIASSLGFRSTPTLVINKKVMPGAISFERLDGLVQEALKDES